MASPRKKRIRTIIVIIILHSLRSIENDETGTVYDSLYALLPQTEQFADTLDNDEFPDELGMAVWTATEDVLDAVEAGESLTTLTVALSVALGNYNDQN